jgi:hypothetical protein
MIPSSAVAAVGWLLCFVSAARVITPSILHQNKLGFKVPTLLAICASGWSADPANSTILDARRSIVYPIRLVPGLLTRMSRASNGWRTPNLTPAARD